LGTVTVRDLEDGSIVTGPLDGDPRLLNRKFDIEWSVNGPGLWLPLSFAPRSIGGTKIRPTLAFEALNGDFDLRFLNQRETAPDDALHGRGLMYGVELSIGSEFPGSPWFAEGGYRFHSLPSTDAERSQPFNSQGARVLSDESRLSRETHDAFTRIGYSFPETQLRTYTGVRYRKANVEVKDDLRFVDTLLQETTLSSRTKLDGSATEAIVGVEARRGSFIGRTEITFNDEDYGVLATVAYVRRAKRSPDFAALAASAAPLLAELEAEFRERRKRLTLVPVGEGDTAYLTTEVEHLLGWTEGQLFEILNARELAPLRDSIRLRFRRFRKGLALISPAETTGNSNSSERAGVVSAAFRLAQTGQSKSWLRRKVDPVLDAAGDLLLQLSGLAKDRRFTVPLCVTTVPREAQFQMWPPEDPDGDYRPEPIVVEREALRGLYVYKIWLKGGKNSKPDIKCPDPNDLPGPDEPEAICLDLLDKKEIQLLECNLRARQCKPPKDLKPPQKCPKR
jgi:hypothetical protein